MPKQTFDQYGRPKRGAAFTGQVYQNEDMAVSDDARRFETSDRLLLDVIIQVTDNDQLFGNATAQTYPVAPGETIGFTHVNLASLYFKNATPGANGGVKILGVEV